MSGRGGWILYVGFAQRDEFVADAPKKARGQQLFEKLSGRPCLQVSYRHVTPEFVARLQPHAIVMSGFGRSFQTYPPASLRGVAAVLRATQVPTLCICGSHQLLGFVMNGDLDRGGRLGDQPMRKRRPGEPCHNPDYHPDHFMETGFYAVRILRKDPLFAGFRGTARLCQSHYCEVKRLPPGFVRLAETGECRIQAMRHRARPLYGVQFHPEYAARQFPDGWRVLRNFFRLSPP
jgi:GMP synthase (glutamine-hydrolysing)